MPLKPARNRSRHVLFLGFVILIASVHSVFAATAQKTSGTFRNQLGLFVELAPEDSVLALHRIGSNILAVEIKKPSETTSRTLRQTIPPAVLDKLLVSAESEGIPVETQAGSLDRVSLGDSSFDRGTVSGERKNRLSYVLYQSIFSAYTYGPALASALDLSGNAYGAVVLFGVTGSIAANSVFGYTHSFEDSHIYSLRYSGSSSIFASYLTSTLILGGDDNLFRLGSCITLGAYPLSLWLGYQHGSAFIDNPGRVDLEPTFTFPFALAGFFLPVLYFGESISDFTPLDFRIMAAQALGLGIAGHMASHLYRPGEHIPAGVPGGISAHTLLAFLAGLSLDFSIEPNSVRAGAAMPIGLAAAGFAEGLWYFQNNSDNLERSNFSWLGMAAGAAFGGGIVALTKADQPGPIFWTLTAGAAAGYALTYALLHHEVETTATQSGRADAAVRRISFDFLPIPEAHRLADAHWEMGCKVPGLLVHF